MAQVEIARVRKIGAAYHVEGHVDRKPVSGWLTAQDVEGLSEQAFYRLASRGLENIAGLTPEELRAS